MIATDFHDGKLWNRFLLSQPSQAGIFLQSWEWLEFQESLGFPVSRIAVIREDSKREIPPIIGVSGQIQYALPRGWSYYFSPRGPVAKYGFDPIQYHNFFKVIKKKILPATTPHSNLFWRFEPLANQAAAHKPVGGYGAPIPLEGRELHTSRERDLIGDSRITVPVHPKQTLLLDLTQNDHALLAHMHEKTRYNLRLAIKKGVTVRESGYDEKEYAVLWNLLDETSQRNKFRTHERDYYKAMLQRLSKQESTPENFHVRLFMAYAGDTPLAGAIVGYFGDTATYLHGASSRHHRAFMGPYALHWHIIQNTKQQGYKTYDWWGIRIVVPGQFIPRKDSWDGMTRFKMGFGGNLIEYPGTFDLPFDKFWYTLYRIARTIRRMS